jgi:hypothetical protein
MAGTGVAEPTKLKVFISYSQKDEDFAQELLAGLETIGFDPYLDKHDIATGEDWEARLGRLNEAADTVVFVISPEGGLRALRYCSLRSPVCTIRSRRRRCRRKVPPFLESALSSP